MGGTKDRVEGTAQDLKGKVKEKVGDATDNEDMQAEGVGDQVKGKAKDVKGNVKESAEDVKETIKR